MGINKATNLSIIHASHLYGGLQIPTCWDLQGSQHLNLLLGHIQLGDTVGKQLLLTMDYLYMHLGLPEPVMTYNYERIKKIIEPTKEEHGFRVEKISYVLNEHVT